MVNKNLIKIINEEISEFDFLGDDERQEDAEIVAVLSNEDLQKQFICDSLLRKETTIKEIEVSAAQVGGDWEMSYTSLDNAQSLTLEYDVRLAYTYDTSKPPVEFSLALESDSIGISLDGWYDAGHYGGTTDMDRQEEGEAWFDELQWLDIDVKIFTIDNGEEIKFTAFEKAPWQIKNLFIREYVEDFITGYTNLELRTDDHRIKIGDVPYC